MDWFDELVRKVRWKAIAWQEGWTPLEQDPRRNDPMTSWQLGLPFPKSTNVPPIGDDWLNEGIQAGREFLSRSLTSGHSVPHLINQYSEGPRSTSTTSIISLAKDWNDSRVANNMTTETQRASIYHFCKARRW